MNFFLNFWFLWKGLWILLLTSPQPPPDIKLKSSYARKFDFSLLCPNMEIQPQAPKNGIFQKNFIFLKMPPTSPQPSPDIKFKSNYARKRDFGLLCPNMKIRPYAPKNGIFQKIFIFLKGLLISLLTSPQPPADIKYQSSCARKHIIKKVESRTQLFNPEWRSYQSFT